MTTEHEPFFPEHSPFFKCPRCEKNDFELAKLKLQNTDFMPVVIKCRSCGTVIGAVPAEEFNEYRRHFPSPS